MARPWPSGPRWRSAAAMRRRAASSVSRPTIPPIPGGQGPPRRSRDGRSRRSRTSAVALHDDRGVVQVAGHAAAAVDLLEGDLDVARREAGHLAATAVAGLEKQVHLLGGMAEEVLLLALREAEGVG